MANSGFSFVDIIFKADFVVQLVVLMLFIASVWSWAIIINKWMYFKNMEKKAKKFDHLFESGGTLGSIFNSIKDHVSAPNEYIFVKTVNELQRHKIEDSKGLSEQKREHIKSRVQGLMITYKNHAIDDMENNISHLATISTAAPFIGLFGTVWGIIHSFQSIALSKNVSLTAVAPGIAEALFATALGLVAAIPALMFYNIFLNQIKKSELKIDGFLMDFNSRIAQLLHLQD